MHAGSNEAGSMNSRSGSARADRARRRRLIVLLLLIFGVALRLLQYAANRSLWLDEALIASSILGRDLAGLAEPLDFGQTAPYGFLLLVRGAVTALGTSEYVLRLVPLLAGLGALALFPMTARRYVSAPARTVALALFALAPFLVYYASELKQYSMDVLVSVAVLWMAAGLRDRTLRPGVAAAIGAAAVWLAQPAIFMLTGAGLTLALLAALRRDAPRLRALLPVGTIWLASFMGAYAISRRSLADPEYMASFWRAGFLPSFPLSGSDWLWLPERIYRIFREPLGVMGDDPLPLLGTLQSVAGMAALTAGAIWMARKHAPRLAVLGLPLLLVVLAAMARLYPFAANYQSSGRVLMFLIPSLVLVMSEGAVRLGRLRPGGRVAAASVVGLMLLPSVGYAAAGVPHVRAEVKPLLDYSVEEREPGDLLYVYYNAWPQAMYYLPRYGWTPDRTVRGICSRLRPAGYIPDLERLSGAGRVWFLFVDGKAVDGYDERRLMLTYLSHVGRRLDDQVSVGASLYLYDLSAGDTDPGPFRVTVPEFAPDPAIDCRGPWGPR